MPAIVLIFFGGSVAAVGAVVLSELDVPGDVVVVDDPCRAVAAAASDGDQPEDRGGHDETTDPPEIGAAQQAVQSTRPSPGKWCRGALATSSVRSASRLRP